ncbi:acetyltransferase [Acuticoccus sediminis]|uniref:Acetyltransferase n=1 Tax=Acuticoccus sediminis TaxID=2184697 RepID=A0A8B2NL66_9HYPH|nr:acetyltransferase [Acuticoccus sediminis]RAH98343.1 acetyltransferase [Acuticoccus sediminis]
MRNPSLVLVGFSGNAIEIFEAAERERTVVAILDDNPVHAGKDFEGVPIRPLSALPDYEHADVVCLVGSQHSYRRRKEIIRRLGLPPSRFATIVHPHALVSRFASIGRGVVLYQGVTVTANAVIGDHVIVLPNTVIHHDVVVGDHCVIGTHVTIAGHCHIGDSVYVGSASSIRDGTTVGAEALIGMAANVVRDVEPGTVVAGNPARPRPRREG